DPLERLAEVRVRAVLVGDVEQADAAVERVADDPGESLDAEPGLVARLAGAVAAGPHADERDLDAGLAERHLVGRALGQARPRRDPGGLPGGRPGGPAPGRDVDLLPARGGRRLGAAPDQVR